MKRLLLISMGIVIIFLCVLSMLTTEVSSTTTPQYCWELKSGGPEPCWDKARNCFCPIIVTPDGGTK